MVLLFGFGVFNVLFYSGEILSCYALAGLFIILFRNLSNRILLLLAIICLLEPWELGKLMYMLANPSYIPDIPDWKYYERAVEAATQSNSIFEVMKVNLTAGMANAHLFAWRSGRYFQTVALFMLGLILGRKSLFIQSESSNSFWKKAFFFSIPAFIILYLVQRKVNSLTGQSALQQPLSTLCSMWENFAFMTFLVSSFVLLWFNSGVKSLLAKLIPYGRMSLSNYITCSIIGSFLYYNYGLGLWDKLGTTYSLLVGITIFTIQVLVSKWWLKKHRQGPLEKLWYKLTWIGRNNLKNHN